MCACVNVCMLSVGVTVCSTRVRTCRLCVGVYECQSERA